MALTTESSGTTLGIGEVVRAVRLAIHMSQGDLAHAMGVGWVTVRRWESGAVPQKDLNHLRELLRRPMLRLRLWRSPDAETLAIAAGLAEPMRDYARSYGAGARQLLAEGFLAELAKQL